MQHCIEHKGYVIVQSHFNWHCLILKDERALMHIHRNTPASDEELREMVEKYIKLDDKDKLWEAYKGAREDGKEEDI